MNSRIATLLSITVMTGMFAVATGCAVAPAGTETEEVSSAAQEVAPAQESKGTTEESSKVETESKMSPETATCKAPLDWCTCSVGGVTQTWCTTLAACFRVCGDRVR